MRARRLLIALALAVLGCACSRVGAVLSNYSVVPSVSTIAAGQPLSVSWTAPAGSAMFDWVGLFKAGDPNTADLWWSFTSGAPSGSFNLTAPSTPGTYEFRYFLNNSRNDVARSTTVTVPGAYALTASPASTQPGGALSVSWTAPVGSAMFDWVGLFKVGDPNTAELWWNFTGGRSSGSFNVSAPTGSGNYEFRYFLNNGRADVARSTPVTVQVNCTVSPSTTAPAGGAAMSVAWTAPSGAAMWDWVGLFRAGDPNSAELWWNYTWGVPSGSTNLTAPANPGAYEFRYFRNNSRTDVARSAQVSVTSVYTVSPSTTSVGTGASFAVNWVAPAGSPMWDWIGLFRAGDPNSNEVWWYYTGGTATGNRNLSAPTTPGSYEFRYFRNNSRTDVVARSSSVAVTLATLPAPTGLTALGQWTGTAQIVLQWNGVSGATSYNLYRDGALFRGGLLAGAYTDGPLTSGETHSYQVAALGPGGESPRSSAVSGTAPSPPPPPPASTSWIPPVNLRIKGQWQNGSIDILTWDPVPGAVSYNIYQYYDLLASGVTGTTYTVPVNRWMHGLTYAVTAVDSTGAESIPSNIVSARDANPQPVWTPNPPLTPKDLTVAGEWNAGNPRLHVFWNGTAHQDTYTVYRDGVKVAEGLWGHHYYDTSVQAGERHSYTVSATNLAATTLRESSQTAPVSGTAPTGPPSPAAGGVTITRVVPNDDSVMVYFNAVAGAADYRVYTTANPGEKKYSAGGLSIELNGLNPATGADLVVEAVDKLGPFQAKDGAMGPGAMLMNGSVNVAVNGIGDPSNVPIVLSSSSVFHVNCQARSLTGAQAFFDTFRGSQPFVSMPPPQPLVNIHGAEVKAFENDRWKLYNVMGDARNTRIFVMDGHFMDTMYDGGTPPTNVTHNNNASLVLQPKQNADISGGRVLHVTFEVDAHMNSRRWCDLILADPNDPIIRPGLFAEFGLFPTVSGNAFRWEVKDNAHSAQIFRGVGGGLQQIDLIDNTFNTGSDYLAGGSARVRWDRVPLANGTQQDLDKRHQFDLYLSQTRIRAVEDGRLVVDKSFPAGVTLPFSQVAVYFVHEVYHTDNDRLDIIGSFANSYWINHRPWADERHWDNMGFEVLNAFPQ